MENATAGVYLCRVEGYLYLHVMEITSNAWKGRALDMLLSSLFQIFFIPNLVFAGIQWQIIDHLPSHAYQLFNVLVIHEANVDQYLLAQKKILIDCRHLVLNQICAISMSFMLRMILSQIRISCMSTCFESLHDKWFPFKI